MPKSRRQIYIGPDPNAPPPPLPPTPLPDLIFADGFETGNLSAWTNNTNDGGNLSVTSATALQGSQGLQAVLNDNNAIYVTDDTPNLEIRYRARFYFDPNSIAMVNGNAHFIFYGYSGSTTQVLRIELRRQVGTYQLRAALLNDGTAWTPTAWYTISDAPHMIEVEWLAATGPGVLDGGLAFWIDGVLQETLTERVAEFKIEGVPKGSQGVFFAGP